MPCFEMSFEVIQVVITLLTEAVPDVGGGCMGEVLMEDPVCVVGEGRGAVLADGAAVDW